MHRSLLASFLLFVACSTSEGTVPPPAAEVVRIPVTVQTPSGPVTFQSELAMTPAERARGLMFREELGAREGMLFVFPAEDQLSFWMKNTLIPLDMVFIRADQTILGVVHEAEPETTSPRRVTGRSQYVLEIPGGVARELGIAAEQSVQMMVPSSDS